MKTLIFLSILFCFAGCSNARQMMSNTKQANEKMEETIVLLNDLNDIVLVNTAGVERSTAEVKRLQKVNNENSEIIKGAMGGTAPHVIVPLAGFALLLLLILPVIVLGISFFKFRSKRK